MPEDPIAADGTVDGALEEAAGDDVPADSAPEVFPPLINGPFINDPFDHHAFLGGDIFRREEKRSGVHWSVAWSDLMMTMFIFFVVLYAYSVAHREFLTGEGLGSEIGSALGTGVIGEGGGGGIGEEAIPALEVGPKIFDLSILAETAEAEDIREFASIELALDRTVRIILTGDLFFDLGKAELRPGAKKKLIKIAELLRRSPNTVNVIGHTDNIPMHSERFPSNWELSVVRATAVARFLIDEMKLPGNRFYVSGHAHYQPVKQNTTASNRAANRRVEIVITRDMPQAMAGSVGDVL